MYPDMSPDYDSSSSCCNSTSSAGDTPARSQQSPDSLSSSSSTESTKDLSAGTGASAAASFVPTLTAISSSPDLQWMVQPTVITSASSSSSGRAKRSKAHSTDQLSSRASRSQRKSSIRKGPKKLPSSEEDDRRQIRRERNKIAAAKCRNRRKELTDTLQAETDMLEDDKTALQTEIADLLKEKERLEQILASHKQTCTLSDHEDDIEDMLQDPPASPPVLSILENGKHPEGNAVLEGPSLQDMDTVAPSISAMAILGNSNILLCSSAKAEPMEDLKGDDLEDLVPSLELTVAPDTAASVPDIDLGGPFCLPDWETLYKSVANDLDPLGTPFVSSSPTCSNYRSVFTFSCSEIDSLADGCESLKASLGRSEFMKDSLNSPTLLAL